MSHKLSISVINEDVRPLAATVANLIIGRFSKRHQEVLTDLSAALSEGGSVEILEQMENLSSVYRSMITELEDFAELVEEIDKAEADISDSGEEVEPPKKTSKKK